MTTIAQFEDIKPDLATSLVLLLDVENMHKSRLDCYKIMSGNYKATLEVFSLHEVISDRLSQQKAIAKATATSQVNSVDFVIDLGEMADYQLRGDLYVLNHLFSNFLSNACKNTFRGEIRVKFAGEEDGLLRFSVRDTGKGMTKMMSTQLFNREVTRQRIRLKCRGKHLQIDLALERFIVTRKNRYFPTTQ